MIKHFTGLEQINFPEHPHKKNHKRVTFKLPKSTEKAVHSNMIKRDYGLRGKTRWVIEALTEYLDNDLHPYRKQLIMECEGIRNKDGQSTILLPDELWEKSWRESIDAALFGANSEPPDFINPSIGLVLLAAILTRLTYEKVSDQL